MEIVKKVIGFGLLAISVFCFDSVMIIALSGVASTLISSVINAFPNKKLINYSYLEQARDILPALILGAVMGAAVYSVQFIGLSPFLTLLIQIPLGAAIYILGAKIFKFDTFTYIISLGKSFLKKA